MREIKIAKSDSEIEACYDVMAELRPHIPAADFLDTVKRLQERWGYRLAYLLDGDVKAVAGLRIAEWLANGRYLEIEDLVVKEEARSNGYGGELFDWIAALAKREECEHVRLVSHVRRFDAHRFYLNKKMMIEAHYFSMPL
jgi:GNAT superfamily N-acetyltransferase